MKRHQYSNIGQERFHEGNEIDTQVVVVVEVDDVGPQREYKLPECLIQVRFLETVVDFGMKEVVVIRAVADEEMCMVILIARHQARARMADLMIWIVQSGEQVWLVFRVIFHRLIHVISCQLAAAAGEIGMAVGDV